MLFQECGHAQHGDAEVEVVAAIGAGEIDGYHAAVVIDNGRAAGALHGGDAVHHAVAIGLLGDGAAGKLGADAAGGLGKGHATVVAYHIEGLIDFELVAHLDVGFVDGEDVLPIGGDAAVELEQSEVGVGVLGDALQGTGRLHEVVPRSHAAAVIGNAELGVELDIEVVVQDVLLELLLDLLGLPILLLEALELGVDGEILFLAHAGVAVAVVVGVDLVLGVGLERLVTLVHRVLQHLDILGIAHDDGVHVLAHGSFVDLGRHHVAVGQDAALVVDEEPGAVEHAGVLPYLAKVGGEVAEIAILVESGEIEMGVVERNLVVELIADEHYARLLLAEDLLGRLLASRDEAHHAYQRNQIVVVFHIVVWLLSYLGFMA